MKHPEGKRESAKLFRATATPLSSIFGSGFLVIVPILAGVAGPYSLPAMAGISLLAYAVGSVIRYNIANVEPVLESNKILRKTLVLDRLSDIALIPAYVISVCLYIKILSSFLLSGLGPGAVLEERILTSTIVCAISVIGVTKGLKGLQKLENWAIWSTMAIIILMIAGFLFHDVRLFFGSGLHLPVFPRTGLLHALAVLGGTLICVQGFETSRYLGEEYNASMRIKSCRLSQIIAAAVYIVFIAVATPLMSFLTGPARDDALIVLAAKVSVILPLPLIAAAVLSQFSAAVADTLGGEGNIVEASRERISHRIAYVAIGIGAFVITWSASTLQTVALASRAFAFYYSLQCFVAVSVSRKIPEKTGMIILAIILLAITVFATPAG